MKPKQVIDQLQSIKYEIEYMLKNYPKVFEDEFSEKDIKAIDYALTIIGAFDTVKWERDIAIEQLHDLGYEFGQKVKENNDE